MTAYTPNLALPYPDGADAPCDFAQDWCGFTDAVQVVLDRFETTADRVNPVIPIAYMRKTGPGAFVQGQLIPFTEVLLDTAGWIDFDANPTLISPDIGGRLTLNGYVDVSIVVAGVPPPATSLLYFDIPGLSGPTSGLTTKPNSNFTSFLNNGIQTRITVEQDIYISDGTFVKGVSGIGLTFAGVVGPLSVTLGDAALSVFWHADGPNP